ncbi:hypothetical protein SFC43_13085 [Bacteroides sp. CR5/BHMF/2]|nr:hypothetical protein [Bacteroides sp. CR5/BHMF/2]
MKASYTEIEKADKQMQALEDSESSVGECLEIITGLLAPCNAVHFPTGTE